MIDEIRSRLTLDEVFLLGERNRLSYAFSREEYIVRSNSLKLWLHASKVNDHKTWTHGIVPNRDCRQSLMEPSLGRTRAPREFLDPGKAHRLILQ